MKEEWRWNGNMDTDAVMWLQHHQILSSKRDEGKMDKYTNMWINIQILLKGGCNTLFLINRDKKVCTTLLNLMKTATGLGQNLHNVKKHKKICFSCHYFHKHIETSVINYILASC